MDVNNGDNDGESLPELGQHDPQTTKINLYKRETPKRKIT